MRRYGVGAPLKASGIVVSIHQPNFFPWLGFFDKLVRSDIFVLLDDAQLPKTGGSWTNRCKILTSGEEGWVTAPVKRNFAGTRLICESVFADDVDWRAKALQSLHNNYRAHKHYEEVMVAIDPVLNNEERNIAKYNIATIETILSGLGFSSDKLRRSSTLRVDSSASERLVDLTKKMGGATYLSGDGSAGYLESTIFEQSRLSLVFQNFHHPVYPQKGVEDFVAGLTILDCLFNIGWEGTRNLLRAR